MNTKSRKLTASTDLLPPASKKLRKDVSFEADTSSRSKSSSPFTASHDSLPKTGDNKKGATRARK
jgi:hypothetical protein